MTEITTYIQKNKRFSTTEFTEDIVNQISTMHTGNIIINNIRVPIRDGALDLTCYEPKEEKPITKQRYNAAKQKRYRERQKSINAGKIDNVQGAYLTINAHNKTPLREPKHTTTSLSPKRIITAKHITESIDLSSLFALHNKTLILLESTDKVNVGKHDYSICVSGQSRYVELANVSDTQYKQVMPKRVKKIPVLRELAAQRYNISTYREMSEQAKARMNAV